MSAPSAGTAPYQLPPEEVDAPIIAPPIVEDSRRQSSARTRNFRRPTGLIRRAGRSVKASWLRYFAKRSFPPSRQSRGDDPWTLPIRICKTLNGKEDESCLAMARLDSGGPRNLISRHVVENRLKMPINWFDSPKSVQVGLTWDKVYAIGTINLRWRSENPTRTLPKYFETEFNVTQRSDVGFEVIVGSETCNDEQILSPPNLGAPGTHPEPAKPVKGLELEEAKRRQQRDKERDSRLMRANEEKKKDKKTPSSAQSQT
ncbi:MAG: hypothetical protein M1821_004261 [Bathelium mastoideum]|nr:MAG: hypothetical protein M1821_004261 [Bathelium mastoideum]